jgi:hypothetical protein
MGGAEDLAERRRWEIGVGKHEENRTLERSMHRWEDNIK